MSTAVMSWLNICIPLLEKCIEVPANHSLLPFYPKNCIEGRIGVKQRSLVHILSYLLLYYSEVIDGSSFNDFIYPRWCQNYAVCNKCKESG